MFYKHLYRNSLKFIQHRENFNITLASRDIKSKLLHAYVSHSRSRLTIRIMQYPIKLINFV